jgi:hypothetical protein
MFPDMLLTQAQAQLAVTKEAAGASPNRAMLFVATALQLCEWFANHPNLQSFQFTTLLALEDVVEGTDRVLKQRQHIKVIAPGCSELQDADSKSKFFYTSTPFWMLGNGSFTVTRNSASLQALLAAEAGSDDKRVKAYALALELDQAFQRVSQDCYLGEVH